MCEIITYVLLKTLKTQSNAETTRYIHQNRKINTTIQHTYYRFNPIKSQKTSLPTLHNY